MSDRVFSENLYRSFAEFDDEMPHERAPSKKGRKRSHSAVSARETVPKRAQVAAACQSCRKRKSKCDARRPCSLCTKSNINCVYETEQGETHLQSMKRKLEETGCALDTLEEVYQSLGSASEKDLLEIRRRVNIGQRPEVVLAFTKRVVVTHTTPDSRRVDAFLTTLAHSTGSLEEIVDLATRKLAPPQLPNPDAYSVFSNRLVHLKSVESLLLQFNQSGNASPALLLEGQPDEVSSKIVDPPCRVPAVPWTVITQDDQAVSHLVSLFFAWINPAWRFVEQDLFLLGMRSQRIDSDFCSPFLVNSICAIASLYSERDVAFVKGGRDRISRGHHFHDEAIRLWNLEEGRPSITNLQALCILSLESNYRAKDRLTLLSLIPTASRLNYDLSFDADAKRCADQCVTSKDYTRARLSVHWMVKFTQLIMRIAFMRKEGEEPQIIGVPKIHELFEDRVEFWTAYPFNDIAVSHRPALYMQERCRLAEFFQEMHDLILTNSGPQTMNFRDFVNAADALTEKMQHWYRYLPFELQYAWPMSIAVWELQFVCASYLAFSMTLWLAARTHCLKDQKLPPDLRRLTNADEEGDELRSRIAQEALRNAIPLAHTAAQILRDFRQRYSLKISPAWSVQLQAVTVGVLLLDAELSTPASVTPSTTSTPLQPSSQASDNGTKVQIQDSHTAFDEVFRCLLGTSVEVMMARGIARMMYHTALERGTVLSQATRAMLKIMSGIVWRPSDLALVNSLYPNFATTKGPEDCERMMELLKKWENAV